ncbi:MAG TPA: ketoacyl-ACP synthase III [Anaerolineae bacterium]|nr:ketoacyl-ACP synthase III [Anaerolineae bacterium]
MNMRYSKISGWGKYVPEKVLTNFDLEKMVDTSDEWITQRTGIKARRIAADDETTSTMAVAAARKALDVAKLTPADLDLIIVSTSSPDHLVPIVSSTVQHQLGATCPAFTVVTGCTGFVYGLATGHQFIATGAYDNVLVIGVELISRFVDWTDRNTCVLFGDGAGAVVLTPSNTPTGVKAIDLGSDGAKGMSLTVPGLGTAMKLDHDVIDRGDHYLKMDGRTVFKFATRVMPQSTLKVLENAGMTIDDIDLLIPHQANARIVDLAVRRLGISPDKVFLNLQKYGNTSAASIPLALVEAYEEGRIKEGDHVCMVSFGAGLTWASAIVQWGQPLGDSAEIMDEDLIWDIDALRRKLARASTGVRVKARTLMEETSYKASSLMLPLYTSVGRRLPWSKKKEQ